MNLDDHLSIFQGAQAELFTFLGIGIREANQPPVFPEGTHFQHGSGNIDIPTPYPLILDYRNRKWSGARRGGQAVGDDEVLVRADEIGGWEPANVIRFNIMSWWTPEFDASLKIAAVTHLPRVDELHYAQPDKVEYVAGGGIAWGDVCILILKK